MNKKIIKNIIIAICIIVTMLGIFKINMINTKALSPIGNSDYNYEIVKNEFGKDFEIFIKDNSPVKIYKKRDDTILVRIANIEFKVLSYDMIKKDIVNLFNKV